MSRLVKEAVAVRNRLLGLAFAGVLVLVAPAPVIAQEDVRVVPLVRDGHVLVSCELSDGYTDEVRDYIQSGLQTTFSYTVELRMRVPAWVDKTLASAVVSTTVEYDNLTRRHTVSRLLDGRVQDSQVIEDEAQVRKMLTTFDRLPLFRTAKLEANRDYYVLVRARRPHNAAMFWPWDSAPAGSAKFTFIP